MTTEHKYPSVEKEISWLSFNERVMQEAADNTLPLIERVRFLGIYSNNMAEFFRVRVAEVRRRALLHDKYREGANKDRKLLKQINKRVQQLAQRYSGLMKQLFSELEQRNVYVVNRGFELDETQRDWVLSYFKKSVLPHLSPILLYEDSDPGQSLKDGVSYLMVETPNSKPLHYALVEIPTDALARYIPMPSALGEEGKRYIIPLDNIIRYGLPILFGGILPFEDAKVYSISMNRDAEYDLNDEIDYSLMDRMSLGLRQRITAEPVSLSYDKTMPQEMLDFLLNHLGLTENDSLSPMGGYQNLSDLMGFPNLLGSSAKFPPMSSLKSLDFETHETAFKAIRQRDILLYYPYHTFRYFTELVRQASYDPKVVQIKINIYRVAKDSRVLNALLDAVINGKQVTVVVELRARFDEAANIDWARRLTSAGVRVVFGAPSLKIHSKLCLIQREEEGNIVNYAHIGTGNFHEGTARIYTDFSLFTCHPEITAEVEQVFHFIDSHYLRHDYQYLLVSPNNVRPQFNQLIEREMEKARSGKQAEILIKVNNLVDTQLCDSLYKASQAGVKVRGIIRGMCSIVPGVRGVSDNIEIRSIVGRFLEHPRVYVFGSGEYASVYISSADWMTRNLDKRIEVGCPILDPGLKQRILDTLELQWMDNCMSRILDEQFSNTFVERADGEKELNSQSAIRKYLGRVEEGATRDEAWRDATLGD